MDAAANTAPTKRGPGPLSPLPYFLPKIRSYMFGKISPISQTEGESSFDVFRGEKLPVIQHETCFARSQNSSSLSSERKMSHFSAISPASSGVDSPAL